MAYLAAITAGGGVPLFTRCAGELPALKFAAVGSLYGIYTFVSKSVSGAELVSTETETAKVVWKCYNDSVIFVLITDNDGSTDSHLLGFLDYVVAAFVLLLGSEQFGVNVKADIVRRALRNNFSTVDQMIIEKEFIGPRVRAVEVCICNHRDTLQDAVNQYAYGCNSNYACLLLNSRPVVCTPEWWELTTVEASAVFAFLRAQQGCSARDIPVFLPDTSPTVPFRLVTASLMPGAEVVVLCGPEPGLDEVVSQQVPKYWQSHMNLIENELESMLDNIPSSVTADKGLTGFLLINRQTARCVCSSLTTAQTRRMSEASLLEFGAETVREDLLSWYHTVIGEVFPQPAPKESGEEGGDVSPSQTPPSSPKFMSPNTSAMLEVQEDHIPRETYLVAEHRKYYMLQRDNFQLFTVFRSAVPTYALRGVTSGLLTSLINSRVLP